MSVPILKSQRLRTVAR